MTAFPSRFDGFICLYAYYIGFPKKKQPTFLWNFPLRASTVLCIFHRKLRTEREISTNCKNSLPKDIDFFCHVCYSLLCMIMN